MGLGRVASLGLSLAVLLAVAPPSGAVVRIETDNRAQVKFRLDRAVLTTTLLKGSAGQRSNVAEFLWGRRVRAVCAGPRGEVVRRLRYWRQGKRRKRFRFTLDLSNRVRWCVLETPSGGDIAAVRFSQGARE
jgi:hypothetical protein